jgi:excisionase family DNA binding protein
MTDKLLVSIRESAATLGVGVRTIHRYVSLGILPCTRIGRRKLISCNSLVQFAERGVSSATVREHKARGAR